MEVMTWTTAFPSRPMDDWTKYEERRTKDDCLSLALELQAAKIHSMLSEVIETLAHTTGDGMLHLNLHVGVADADVSVTVRVKPRPSPDVDDNGWPKGFFEKVAGSMPEIDRGSQGEFEERLPME